ncbi:MoaD/ThiS family protein [Halorussus marinus]|uniref:MoaD/ThiS family protein n=1 Tax=Halorussus marinus TaxID=2505976 RepID=UPI00106EA775|nr:MoaD/ThiS family protein [Halorussus marinus]
MAPANEDADDPPASDGPPTSEPVETISVELVFYAPFRESVDRKSLAVSLPAGATLRDAVARVADDRPALDGELLDESGEIRTGVRALLNGGDRAKADTELADGDSVSFTTPIHGG